MEEKLTKKVHRVDQSMRLIHFALHLRCQAIRFQILEIFASVFCQSVDFVYQCSSKLVHRCANNKRLLNIHKIDRCATRICPVEFAHSSTMCRLYSSALFLKSKIKKMFVYFKFILVILNYFHEKLELVCSSFEIKEFLGNQIEIKTVQGQLFTVVVLCHVERESLSYCISLETSRN